MSERTVFKYRLNFGVTTLPLPTGASVVYVGTQHEDVYLWVELHQDHPTESRVFIVHGTGHPIDHASTYVGTVQIPPFVWHVYEDES